MIKGYVINLERRPDRLETFRNAYEKHMPKGLPLEVIRAVDGSVENYTEDVPDYLKPLVSDVNDYGTKSVVHATIFSHLKAWYAIANGNEAFGIIFEDDVIFAKTRKEITSVLAKALGSYPLENSILWFGCGDVLPVHFDHPSESMFIAQEKSHVLNELGGYGKPNFKSVYVFDWLGGFSYILSSQVAKKLLEITRQKPIDCAIDSWMKKITNEYQVDSGLQSFLTVPLLTYSTLDDSDTGRK